MQLRTYKEQAKYLGISRVHFCLTLRKIYPQKVKDTIDLDRIMSQRQLIKEKIAMKELKSWYDAWYRMQTRKRRRAMKTVEIRLLREAKAIVKRNNGLNKHCVLLGDELVELDNIYKLLLKADVKYQELKRKKVKEW